MQYYWVWVSIVAALFTKACYNIVQAKRSRTLLRSNIKSRINKNSSEPYILKYKLNPREQCHHLMVKNRINKYHSPNYVKITKGLSVPIGGGNYEDAQQVCQFISLVTDKIKLDPSYHISMSDAYKYETTYVEHRKAVKDLQHKYNFDLSKYKVSSAILDLYDGAFMNDVYLYGSYEPSENKFIATHISDSSETLVSKLAPYVCFRYILSGLVISFCLYMSYYSNESSYSNHYSNQNYRGYRRY